MNIEDIWRRESGSDAVLKSVLETSHPGRLKSQLPLNNLRLNLLMGIVWAFVITLAYVVIFFFFPIWQVYVTLGILIIFNIIISVGSWRLYMKTPSSITPSNTLKDELTIHYESFQRWWSLQQRISLFVYPVALTGGFILGGTLGSGQSVETFLYNPMMLGILGLTLLIMIPVCYFSARMMFNYAYGRHLKKIKAVIDDLNEVG